MRSLFAAAAVLALFLFCLPAATVFPQSEQSLDELFANPEADSEAAEAGEAKTNSLESFVEAKPLSFRGNLSSSIGMIGGWASFPASAADLAHVDLSGYFEFENRLSFDARADRTFSITGTILSAYPDFSLEVEELFFDYSLAEALFFRIGKQKNAWGNGRVFTQTDLMEDSELGLAVKAYLPRGANGLTAALLDQPGWHPDSDYPSMKSLAYLAKAEILLGRIEVFASGRYRSSEGVRTVLAGKTSLRGLDLFHESMLEAAPGKDIVYSAVSGFFWEASALKTQAYGEYAYLGGSVYPKDHRLALAMALELAAKPRMRLKLGTKWEHAFTDASGSLTPALIAYPFPHVSIALGVPLLYGADDSIYVTKSEDPAKRRLSLALAATISAQY